MSSVHDTITEALALALYEDAFTPAEELAPYIEDEPPWHELSDHRAGFYRKRAARILAALESRGFVVRKQVEPEAAKNDASALVAAWNAGFIEGRRP